MRRTVLAVALMALGACHKSTTESAPATLPSIAGTYDMNFVPTDSNGTLLVPDTLAYLGGQITIGPVASDGSFAGSYYLAYITGVLAGVERNDGTIAFTAFGTAGVPPLDAEPYLEQVIPTCMWGGATAGTMSGIVASSSDTAALPALTVRGSVAVQCPSPTDSMPPIPNVVTMFATGVNHQP